MDAIYRSAVIVMPAQPFLDWLHRADPTSAELSLEDLRREPTIYLLPDYNTEEEARGVEIFEEELDGWYRVPSAWPVDRTLDNFNLWFECRFHSLIVDLCDNPLKREEI